VASSLAAVMLNNSRALPALLQIFEAAVVYRLRKILIRVEVVTVIHDVV